MSIVPTTQEAEIEDCLKPGVLGQLQQHGKTLCLSVSVSVCVSLSHTDQKLKSTLRMNNTGK